MFVSPMLLQYAAGNEPFDKEHHVAELKLDGIQLIVSTMDGLKLHTRHENDVTNKFPELHILLCRREPYWMASSS